MKRFETLVIAIPDPTPEEQTEGQARRDREALVHALFHHPWLVHMAEGDWRRGPLVSALLDHETTTRAVAAMNRIREAFAPSGGGSPPADASATPPPAPDAIDHPAHYTSHPSGIEPIQITRHESFTRGNAIKYLMRAGRKDPDPRTDLKKARRYIDFELEDLERLVDRPETRGAPGA